MNVATHLWRGMWRVIDAMAVVQQLGSSDSSSCKILADNINHSLAAMRVDLVLFDTVFFSFDYSCLASP